MNMNVAPAAEAPGKRSTIRLAAEGVSLRRAAEGGKVAERFFPFGDDSPARALEGIFERERIAPGELGRVTLQIDTDRCVLFPDSVWEPGMELDYLKINNIPCADGQMALLSSSPGVRAVMVASREAVERLEGLTGGISRYSSPILESIHRPTRGAVELNLTRKFVYATVFDERLEFTGIFPWEGVADLLHYMRRMEDIRDLRGASVSIVGHGAAEVRKKFARYYRRLITIEPCV